VKVALNIVLFSAFIFLGFMLGRVHEMNDHAERDVKECFACGQTQACAFGPGIVGVQSCEVGYKWGRCEPDPRFKVPREGEVK